MSTKLSLASFFAFVNIVCDCLDSADSYYRAHIEKEIQTAVFNILVVLYTFARLFIQWSAEQIRASFLSIHSIDFPYYVPLYDEIEADPWTETVDDVCSFWEQEFSALCVCALPASVPQLLLAPSVDPVSVVDPVPAVAPAPTRRKRTPAAKKETAPKKSETEKAPRKKTARKVKPELEVATA